MSATSGMPTLLIIDDNESVRDTLRHIFARVGYTVLVAENGMVGLAFFVNQTVDVALIDINMPGMNGVEVCRRMRDLAQVAGRNVPLWLMTGAAVGEIERLGIDAGAIEVLHKPFNILQLAREIAERLEPGKEKAPVV